jgi:nucleoside-diphosphate-sugar epimerase
MIIGVTGSGGFIGEKLVNSLLDCGHSVRILTRKVSRSNSYHVNLEIVIGDLCNKTSLDGFVEGLNIVIHCAAEIRDESAMYYTNVIGTKNLIEKSKYKIQQWIQLSSTGVYGSCFEGIITEESSYNAINLYEKTKLESDLLVINAGESNFFNYTIIRPTNVFGPTMRNQSLLQLISMIDTEKFFFIGSKNSIVNYIHVDNVVDSILMSIHNNNALNQIFNISDSLLMKDFVFIIREVLNKKMIKLVIPKSIVYMLNWVLNFIYKSPLTVARIKHLTNQAVYSNLKMNDFLQYNNRKDLKEGIKELTNFYKNNQC